jgi:hypothetical protein
LAGQVPLISSRNNHYAKYLFLVGDIAPQHPTRITLLIGLNYMKKGDRVKYIGDVYSELEGKIGIITDKISNNNIAWAVSFGDDVYDCWETDLKKVVETQLLFSFVND